MAIFIKQFGLQRSGTNILRFLIEENFEDVRVLSNVLGEKHGPADWQAMDNWIPSEGLDFYRLDAASWEAIQGTLRRRELKILIQTRDPFSWLISYYKYSRAKVLFRNPSAHFELDARFIRRAIADWYNRVSGWLEFADGATANSLVIVRTDEIITAPEAVLDRVEAEFGLSSRDAPPLHRVTAYARAGVDRWASGELLHPTRKFDPSEFVDRKWLEYFDDETWTLTKTAIESHLAQSPKLKELVGPFPIRAPG